MVRRWQNLLTAATALFSAAVVVVEASPIDHSKRAFALKSTVDQVDPILDTDPIPQGAETPAEGFALDEFQSQGDGQIQQSDADQEVDFPFLPFSSLPLILDFGPISLDVDPFTPETLATQDAQVTAPDAGTEGLEDEEVEDEGAGNGTAIYVVNLTQDPTIAELSDESIETDANGVQQQLPDTIDPLTDVDLTAGNSWFGADQTSKLSSDNAFAPNEHTGCSSAIDPFEKSARLQERGSTAAVQTHSTMHSKAPVAARAPVDCVAGAICAPVCDGTQCAPSCIAGTTCTADGKWPANASNKPPVCKPGDTCLRTCTGTTCTPDCDEYSKCTAEGLWPPKKEYKYYPDYKHNRPYRPGYRPYKPGYGQYKPRYGQYKPSYGQYKPRYGQYSSGYRPYTSGYGQYSSGYRPYSSGYSQYKAGYSPNPYNKNPYQKRAEPGDDYQRKSYGPGDAIYPPSEHTWWESWHNGFRNPWDKDYSYDKHYPWESDYGGGYDYDGYDDYKGWRPRKHYHHGSSYGGYSDYGNGDGYQGHQPSEPGDGVNAGTWEGWTTWLKDHRSNQNYPYAHAKYDAWVERDDKEKYSTMAESESESDGEWEESCDSCSESEDEDDFLGPPHSASLPVSVDADSDSSSTTDARRPRPDGRPPRPGVGPPWLSPASPYIDDDKASKIFPNPAEDPRKSFGPPNEGRPEDDFANGPKMKPFVQPDTFIKASPYTDDDKASKIPPHSASKPSQAGDDVSEKEEWLGDPHRLGKNQRPEEEPWLGDAQRPGKKQGMGIEPWLDNSHRPEKPHEEPVIYGGKPPKEEYTNYDTGSQGYSDPDRYPKASPYYDDDMMSKVLPSGDLENVEGDGTHGEGNPWAEEKKKGGGGGGGRPGPPERI